jgi:hypothetical protein
MVDHVNCKPHYLSIMNYNYSYLGNLSAGGTSWLGPPSPFSAFSTGLYNGLALNPIALNEKAGLGDATPNANVLTFLRDVLHLKVGVDAIGNFTGEVDWNGNGVIEAGVVQGMVNTPRSAGDDCDPSAPSLRGLVDWVSLAKPTLSVEGGNLYLNGVAPLGYKSGQTSPALVVGMQLNLSGCSSKGTGGCATLTNGSGGFFQPNPAPGPYAPAVAGGIVTYADINGNLYYFKKASAGVVVSVTAVGGPPISGDPVAIERPSGLITVYAPSGGYLRRWDYFRLS